MGGIHPLPWHSSLIRFYHGKLALASNEMYKYIVRYKDPLDGRRKKKVFEQQEDAQNFYNQYEFAQLSGSFNLATSYKILSQKGGYRPFKSIFRNTEQEK